MVGRPRWKPPNLKEDAMARRSRRSSLRPAGIRAHERRCPYNRAAGDGVVADAIGEAVELELVHIGDRKLRHERGETTGDAGEPGIASEVRAATDECLSSRMFGAGRPAARKAPNSSR